MDPGFRFHLAVARLVCGLALYLAYMMMQPSRKFLTFQMTELTLNLSESVVLPFDVVSYASFLEKDLDKIESRYKSLAAANGATFGNTAESSKLFYII